jgi:hypothetical protein
MRLPLIFLPLLGFPWDSADRTYFSGAIIYTKGETRKDLKRLVEYWSLWDVLLKSPEGIMEEAEIYIKQFPKYHYISTPGERPSAE